MKQRWEKYRHIGKKRKIPMHLKVLDESNVTGVIRARD